MRIVLDTNILVRANPKVPPAGLARDLLLRVVTYPHVLVLSSPILIEVRRVLNYPHVQARWQTAIVGHAEVLCTRDEAFQHDAVGQICQANNVRIIDDVGLIGELRRQTKS